MINSVSHQNLVATELATLLQANNEAAESDCDYLQSAVTSWLRMAIVDGISPAVGNQNETFTLWAQLLPAGARTPIDRLLLDLDLAGVGRDQPEDQASQRRFAAA